MGLVVYPLPKIINYDDDNYCQTFKIGRFAKIVNGYKALTIFAKRSILDVLQVSEYASETTG